MTLIALNGRQRAELEALVVRTPSAKERCRAQALLWLDAGDAVEDVADLLHVSRQTVGVVARRGSVGLWTSVYWGDEPDLHFSPPHRPARPKPARQASKKAVYRIRNWKQYTDALVRRGSLTLWVEQATLKEWRY